MAMILNSVEGPTQYLLWLNDALFETETDLM